MQHSVLPHSTHNLVAFRQLTRTDGGAWYEYLSQPDVFEHTSWNVGSINDLRTLFDSIESADPSSQVRFAVVLIGTGQLVGTIGFHTISVLNKTAEIAYDLAPSVWDKGIGKSICLSLVDWGFKKMGLIRIQATVLETNVRSISVLDKCRFTREGYLRSFRMIRGEPGNFWIYSRICSDVVDKLPDPNLDAQARRPAQA